MNSKQLTKLLQTIGITENESLAYVSLLPLGSTSVLKLARASGIKRTSLYSILESLKDKGLVSEQEKGLKRLFLAENPEKIESILEEASQSLKAFLPQLVSLQQTNYKSATARYFVGFKAIKSCYLEMLQVGEPEKDYLIMGNQSSVYNMDPEFFEGFIKRRAERNFKIRALLTDSPISKQFLKRQSELKMQIKLFPKNTNFESNIIIVPKRVFLHQLKPNQIAVIVDNANLAGCLKEIFEVVWASC